MISGLDESNRLKSVYFTIHPGKNPPPQNGCRLKSILFIYFKSTGFTSSTFPIEPDFSQNQPATITLNTGFPRTLASVNADAKLKGRWPAMRSVLGFFWCLVSKRKPMQWTVFISKASSDHATNLLLRPQL